MSSSVPIPAALVVIGGSYGAGKTRVATQLSADLRILRLDADLPGRAIQGSAAFQGSHADAYRLAYAVLWRQAAEFLRTGLSVILDVNLGWEFHWEAVDELRAGQPDLTFLPVVLRCPLEICQERIRERHVRDPQTYGPPEWFAYTEVVGRFLDQLDRPEVQVVDANRPYEEVYATVRNYVVAHL
jgi:predicted kinase